MITKKQILSLLMLLAPFGTRAMEELPITYSEQNSWKYSPNYRSIYRKQEELYNAICKADAQAVQNALDGGARVEDGNDLRYCELWPLGKRRVPALSYNLKQITPEIINLLVTSGADPNGFVRSNGYDADETVLSCMIRLIQSLDHMLDWNTLQNMRRSIRELIKCGANMNDFFGKDLNDNALNELKKSAKKNGTHAIMVHVIEAQNDQVTELFSALVDAIDRQDTDKIVKILNINPQLVNKRDEFGFTPLYYALVEQEDPNLEVIRQLITYGADVNMPLIKQKWLGGTIELETPLRIATKKNREDLVGLFLANGARRFDTGNHIDRKAPASLTDNQDIIRRLAEDSNNPEEASMCPICFENLASKEIVSLRCGHIFCQDCVNKFQQQGLACPMCRR